MNVNGLTDGQYERLKLAEKSGKYGHLETWKELFVFQINVATSQQNKDIANHAKQNSRLPLMYSVISPVENRAGS